MSISMVMSFQRLARRPLFYNDAYNGSANFTFRANNVTGEYSGISINNSSHNSANNNHDNAVITDILLTGILRLLQDRASR